MRFTAALRRTSIALLALLLCVYLCINYLCIDRCTSLVAADWPQFRGPSGQGISNDANIPIEWSDEKNVKWKLDLPGAGFSSPIVVGDKVFVTCYSDAKDEVLKNLKRHLICVDRSSGKILWNKTVAAEAGELSNRNQAHHGYTSNTPVSDGRRVYVLFGNSGVFAFDMNGNQLWQKTVGRENAVFYGSGASPILYKDMLIVTAACESRSIRALTKSTGKELWKAESVALSKVYTTPVIAKNKDGVDELLVSACDELWSINLKTGKVKWYAATKVDTAPVPSPVVADGVVYAIGGRSGGRTAITIGGKGDMTKTNVLWSLSGSSYVPSPVIYKGHLYWVDDKGVAVCVDTKTGKIVEQKRLGGKFYASVVLIQGKLYALSRYDGTYVLEASPKLTRLAHNKLSDKSDASGSPAVSDGQLFLRSDKCLYCIEAGK